VALFLTLARQAGIYRHNLQTTAVNHAISASDRCILKDYTMAKGKNSKKETKKPKKEKPKISATANFLASKPAIGAKK
jgi:hypothetical protein